MKPGNWLYIPYVSPDKNFVLIVSEDEVKLYNKKFQLLSTLDTNTDYINWRPDSEGALISIKNSYYYFSTITGELTFIEVCGDKNYCIPESVWLPQK